ncbi:hypothetical protein K470DRAFT_116137 [Piedraia hortae CBS 480.64]|uniref:Uncharacterized protein n=1 Tax=Piedraia hortae CBS 480.64 TaxID=1314780 RepID=A0A6A7BUM3_9PEZI|nr:hypothetical protein K470DRAFT_116137 [Piedraia hortae CBS 480.64]
MQNPGGHDRLILFWGCESPLTLRLAGLIAFSLTRGRLYILRASGKVASLALLMSYWPNWEICLITPTTEQEEVNDELEYSAAGPLAVMAVSTELQRMWVSNRSGHKTGLFKNNSGARARYLDSIAMIF